MTRSRFDRSAEIARYIMHGDAGPDPRYLIFDILKTFHGCTGDEFKRGMEIALEIYEATEIEQPEGRA